MEFESVVEKKCLQLLQKALDFEATDVHLLPTKEAYSVYFRKYNRSIATGEIPLKLGDKMISHLKYQSGLDISERRRPQSGSFEYVEGVQTISCRVSTLPSVTLNESIIIRLMLQDVAKNLEEIAFSMSAVSKLKKLAQNNQGIIFFCGPTGCGKSTTMYSLLNYCSNQLSKHVISLEDPVENNQNQMLQVQVNEKSGVTYAIGLKAILRHSPDVIMIGEIRDSETAKIAIEAALTGHLVITTIHAKDSFGCLHRLMDLGVSQVELQQTVLSIVTQSLVNKQQENRELTALFEIMDDHLLLEAFDALKHQENFSMPTDETIAYQVTKGVQHGQILANILTTP
ncbi:MAG: Flp pilus assembly complex ATPase component TadA [Kurthia sp.]|nr:Flp pilus assembly complex ATPase component TadA [Candidatus Kurthia equi]